MMMDKRLINTVSESKKYIVGNVACQWVSLAANITMMTAVTRMLMQLYNGEDAGIAPIAAVIVAAVIVRFVCARLSSKMSYLSSKAVKKTLREKIYEKLLRIGLSYKESVQTSEIVQVAVEGVDQLETYFGAYLPQFFLCHAGTAHAFCGACEGEFAVGSCAAYLCSAYSGVDSACADMGEEAFVKILGTVHGSWRHIP